MKRSIKKNILKEFVALSDPLTRLPLPEAPAIHRIPPETFFHKACFHGVHPIVHANLENHQKTERYPKEWWNQLMRLLSPCILGEAGRCLMLRAQGEKILQSFQEKELDALILKGADFADHLYPLPARRSFTDIDILVPRPYFEKARMQLLKMGHQPLNEGARKHDKAYGEEVFTLASGGISLRVELHWNLVNSPALQKSISVQYDDLVNESGLLSNEGRLLIAAVHGATGHQFDRLKFLIDLLQIFRSTEGVYDLPYLARQLRKTGAEQSLSMGCWLVYALFKKSDALQLLTELNIPRPSLITRLALQSSALLNSESPRWPEVVGKKILPPPFEKSQEASRMCVASSKCQDKKVLACIQWLF